jgi:hypothetical protein
LRLTVLASVVTWAAFAGGLAWGIVGVAAFYAAAKWLLVIPATWITTRALAFDFWSALRASTAMLPATIVAGAVGVAARQLLLQTSLPEAVRLVLVGAAMLVVYGAVVVAFAPSVVREVRRAVRRADETPLHGQPA